MRADFPPPPASSEELVELSPHEIIRRFPESLHVFRRHGVDLRARGAGPLSEVVEEEGEEAGRLLIRELDRALEWRAPAGS